jgi:hypothetical protein
VRIPRRPRWTRWATFLALAALVVVTISVVVDHLGSKGSAAAGECKAVSGQATAVLDTEQAANATTIAAIGKRLGVPDHGVTIALAAALQESGLRNLPRGDRDSLGLFQQRPSQGWGSSTDIMSPTYAATAFYSHLLQVPGWDTLPVAGAAQAVQHSAQPDAYARFEQPARALASALTGELPAAFSCQYRGSSSAASSAVMRQELSAELGAPTLDSRVTAARGWTVAGWLVGHAWQYGLESVTFAGMQWSATAGWRPTSTNDAQVHAQGPSSGS